MIIQVLFINIFCTNDKINTLIYKYSESFKSKDGMFN